MTLLDRIFSGGLKWKCQRCGKVHKSNPEQCKECGHTVLQQVRTGTTASDSVSVSHSSRSSPLADSDNGVWVCDRCKQSHDQKPDECKVCGRSSFTKQGADETPDVDKDMPTFSNINEVREYEQQERVTSQSKVRRAILILVLVAIGVLIALVIM